jgi:hypothetical protein
MSRAFNSFFNILSVFIAPAGRLPGLYPGGKKHRNRKKAYKKGLTGKGTWAIFIYVGGNPARAVQ